MTQPLNLYGDRVVRTTGKHGVDIASQRMDDLDIAALQYALQKTEKRGVAIDLGCGSGMQGLRFAALGFKTMLIDWLPIEMTVLRIAEIDQMLPLSYVMKDVRTLTASELPDEVAFCYSQRFIQYLQFEEAVTLLRLLRARMPVGAKLFLSASGLLSELGDGYEGRKHPLTRRFAVLARNMANKHDIHEPVCLYTLEDLIALCRSAAFLPEHVFSSPFGNVKGIFTAA